MFKSVVKRHVNATMEPVKKGFENVARDIRSLQTHVAHLHTHTGSWHNYLHQKTIEIESKLRQIKANATPKVSDEITQNIAQIEQKLQHYKDQLTKSEQEKEAVSTEIANLKQHLQQIFQQYNKHILDIHQKLHSSIDEQQIRAIVKEEVHASTPVSRSEPSISSAEPSEIPQVQSTAKPLRHVAHSLTSSQKSIMAILAQADQKLSYRDLAALYGKSASTVKTLLWGIKNAGVPILEVSEDGIKRFYLADHFKQAILSKRL